MNRLGRYWRAQPLLSVLLLAALLTRGLIPVGYMPASGQGFFALELCTAPQYRLPFAHDAPQAQGAARAATSAELAAPWEPRAPTSATHSHAHDSAASEHAERAGALYLAAGEGGSAGAIDGSLAPGAAHDHEHGGRKTPAGHDSPCPFAVTALSAPPPAAIVHAISVDAIVVQAVREPQVAAALLISRSQSARAPPALS